MPHLKTSISNAKTLQDLADILKNSNAKVSFFGQKYIANENFSSTVSISLVAKKAISMLQPFLKDWTYSVKDRKNIVTITQKIDGFYLKTDEDLYKCNIITKIFNWFISLPTFIYSIRRKWEKLPDLCNFYSEKQFKEAFPQNALPDTPDDIYKKINIYLPPEKIIKSWYKSLIDQFSF